MITKPYADDFEIVTNNKIKHQKLQNDIQKKSESMGLILKPSKCRSLSITSGKPTNITFTLKDPNSDNLINLKTLEDDPFKFFGSTITFRNTAAENYDILNDMLTKKLENLDKCLIRGEYKVAIYSRYLLPSLRFHMSVHSIHQTQLDKLDHLLGKYLTDYWRFS